MGTLKSAWEIGATRIIASNYARQIEREEIKKRKENKERLDSMPDFVAAWEQSQNEDSVFAPSIVEDIENNPTTFISKESYVKDKLEPIKEEYKDNGGIIVQEPETIHTDKDIEIHWYGHFTSYSGFSRMNRAMVFGLANRNVRIKIDLQPSKVEINDATRRELANLEKSDVSPSAPKVFGATIPLSMSHGGKKILYTMMENDQTLHKEYVERLNLFDEVWVPTKHGEKMFKRNGVTRPIMVMPLGVEISRYHSQVTPANIPDLASFRFLSVFKWGYRKGYDILLKAYMDEFSSQDDVSLILVSRSDHDHNPNRIAEDFKAIRMGIDKKDEDLPHICLYSKLIPEKDMPGIYKAGNAFCLISRGEGFGMPYIEAASCGLPIISSNCSAMTDYLNDENSFLVEPDDYVKATINGPLSKLAKHCHFYENQIFPDFGPVSIMKTREHMRYVFENYNKALTKASLLQKQIRENYSWDAAVNRVFERLKYFK